ncbi:MAG: N-6 DNA methylase [Candidatus Levyibacteriota bacterium]
MKQTQQPQKGTETWKQLEEIHRFGYSFTTIFSDFIDLCLFPLLSLTYNMQFADVIERLQQNQLAGTYEDEYMQLVKKYPENNTKEKGKRPADYFKNAWGMLLKETHEAQRDILGELFMVYISHGEHGQFFTPQPISDMMALIVNGEGRGERKTVSDPAGGSGRFFISIAKHNKNLHYYGVDLSPICAKMTALNMWLFNLTADIYHGDSLSMKMHHVWKIRKGGYIYEAEIAEEQEPMPKPIKQQIQNKVKQQQLFDFDEVGK